ncbi:unnamed protein product, partial [Aphanomyces euteiches]
MSGYQPIAPAPSRWSSWPVKVLAGTAIVGLGVALINQPWNVVAPTVSPVTSSSSFASDNNIVEAILAKMTMEQKAAQMVHFLDGANPDPRLALNKTRVREYAKLGVGSFFGSSNGATWSIDEWNGLVNDIKTIYAEENAIPMIYGIDTTHGAGF